MGLCAERSDAAVRASRQRCAVNAPDLRQVTTIERLARGELLPPLQAESIDTDGFQCGYCTPGQIMSGAPGNVSAGVDGVPVPSLEEIRERMSGNIRSSEWVIQIFLSQ